MLNFYWLYQSLSLSKFFSTAFEPLSTFVEHFIFHNRDESRMLFMDHFWTKIYFISRHSWKHKMQSYLKCFWNMNLLNILLLICGINHKNSKIKIFLLLWTNQKDWCTEQLITSIPISFPNHVVCCWEDPFNTNTWY